MGIIQFLVLTLFVLVYVAIIGGLLARVIARSNEMKKQSHSKPEEMFIGG
jgi:CDP-diglyceride synthetase